MDDSSDDLAAFLMHRTSDPGVAPAQVLQIFALVGAYQEGDDVALELRRQALAFATHPAYRPEWSPSAPESQHRRRDEEEQP